MPCRFFKRKIIQCCRAFGLVLTWSTIFSIASVARAGVMNDIVAHLAVSYEARLVMMSISTGELCLATVSNSTVGKIFERRRLRGRVLSPRAFLDTEINQMYSLMRQPVGRISECSSEAAAVLALQALGNLPELSAGNSDLQCERSTVILEVPPPAQPFLQNSGLRAEELEICAKQWGDWSALSILLRQI